ncbi:MAG: PDR/VanB family oxidoreductase [Proteobacteria bacterium]|nr:PDR/VanB family oxidoreductase [Pseudomonadota bacterium]
MSKKSGTIDTRLTLMRWECPGVLSLTLSPLAGRLPRPEPGAHVDLHLPGGMVRQYSLTAGSSSDAYVLGILREPRSRGGSAAVHETLRPGDVLRISAPRNAFALDPGDGPVLLIAGGIGMTPLLAMAETLSQGTRPWSMIACVRSRKALPFAGRLSQLGARVRADDEDGVPDLPALLAGVSPDTHLYCCGPGPMLDAFLAATADRDPGHVHLERFEQPRPTAGEGEVAVDLARSGRTIVVGPQETILDALLAAGVDAAHSCRVGVCGTCECQVLDGEPDHRDLILTSEERGEGRMLICCSRAKTPHLVLDL